MATTPKKKRATPKKQKAAVPKKQKAAPKKKLSPIPSADIKRQVLDQKIVKLQVEAYELSLNSSMATVQAEFYSGQAKEQMLREGKKLDLNARSLYAAVSQLQSIRDKLPEPAAKTPDPEK